MHVRKMRQTTVDFILNWNKISFEEWVTQSIHEIKNLLIIHYNATGQQITWK